MFKKLGKKRSLQAALAFMAERYLTFVQRTSRFRAEPAGQAETALGLLPAIPCFWHGQHLIVHYAWPRGAPLSALLSRHSDAEVNAMVLPSASASRRSGVLAGSRPRCTGTAASSRRGR